MMFNAFNAECDSSSRCSTASPSGENVGYYPSPAGSYSSMESPQSQVCPVKYYYNVITVQDIRYLHVMCFVWRAEENLQI